MQHVHRLPLLLNPVDYPINVGLVTVQQVSKIGFVGGCGAPVRMLFEAKNGVS
jgi:hypothetical protein